MIEKAKQRVWDYINRIKPETLEKGSYDLDNGDFLKVVEYQTKNPDEYLFEKHEKFIDGFYMIDGIEKVLTTKQGKLVKEYSPEKDVSFFTAEEYKEEIIKKGDLMILVPEVLHCPCLDYEKTTTVKKAIFKISIENVK